MRTIIWFAASAVTCHLSTARPAIAQGPQEWGVASGDWNAAENWINFVVPDSQHGDTALINNGGVAVLTGAAAAPVGGVAVGPGSLELTNSGSLSVVDASSAEASATGFVRISGSGTLTLADNANISAEGNINLNGSINVAGPDATLSTAGELNFGLSSVYNATISDPTMHSVFSVDGTAKLAGVLNVEFNGISPTLGDAWTLIDAAAIEGAFGTVRGTGTALGSGQVLAVTHVPGGKGQLAQLTVEQRLVLEVDRQGGTSIRNPGTQAISIEGYTVQSSIGSLAPDSGNWNSLEDQGIANWVEVPSSPNALGELESSSGGSLDVAGGAERMIGEAFDPLLPFGSPNPEDLVFKYRDAATGSVVNGVVEYVGPLQANNLVLSVDPDSGNAQILNATPSTVVDLQGYTITSAEGSLQTSFESDLPDAEWAEVEGSANGVGELNFTASTTALAPADTINLTGVFSTGASQDLVFRFRRAGGAGDFNGDGTVNAADYTVWRDGLGTTFTPAEYDDWRQNFGSSAGNGQLVTGIVRYDGSLPSAGASASVPEPSGTTLSILAVAVLGTRSCRSRRTVWWKCHETRPRFHAS